MGTKGMRLFVVALCLLTNLTYPDELPRRGTLGLPLQAAPAEVRDPLKLGAQEALLVSNDANGLKKGDLIVTINGKPFKTFAEWGDLQRAAVLQKSAKVGIRRNGQLESVEVLVQSKPEDKGDNYSTIYSHVVSNGNRIRTFITRPTATGKRPVLFWIQGINTGSVEQPLTSPGGTSRILKSFSDAGYVTVRVEKPGVGDSEGGPAAQVGFDEELDIYRQALRSFEKFDFVDRSQVFIFGHSMGGCHAPIIASEQPVKGVITYGTVSDSWLEWQIKATRIQSPLGGATRAQVDQEVRQIIAFYHYLYNEKRSIAWIKENRPELRAMADEQSPDGKMLNPRSIQYMQEVNDKNFCDYWAKLGKTRVLALYGEFDWVALQSCQEQVALAVNAANPGMAQYAVVPQSDHIFMKQTTMPESFSRFGRPGSEFNTAVIDAMKTWIAKIP